MGIQNLLAVIVLVFIPVLKAQSVYLNVSGLIPSLFTPIDDDGHLNLDVIPEYAKYLKDNGVSGVVVAATAGEGPILTLCERKDLLDAWMRAARPLNLIIIAQVGGIAPILAQELAEHAETCGVDAILSLPETFFKPGTPEEAVKVLKYIAEGAPNTPVLYYHYPEYSGVEVDMVEFFDRATEEIPTFKGLVSEEFEVALRLQNRLTYGQKILVGGDIHLLPATLMGFDTFFATEFNLFPHLSRDIVDHARKGDIEEAKELYYRKCDYVEAITKEGHPLLQLKASMPLITGIKVGPPRVPLSPLTEGQTNRLKERLREVDVDIIDSEE